MLPKLKPIPMKERISYLFLDKCQVDVLDGAFVVVEEERGVRKQIPVASIGCLFLEPGTRISHNAVALAAMTGTLLIWVGEGGVRLYAAGQPGGARSDRLLWQARLALDDKARLKVVRKMYELRFGEPPPARRSVEQLRALEGSRVKALYKMLAKRHGVTWKNRSYNVDDWDQADPVNRALSVATHCLYGITEAAVLAAGYAPAIGFIHTGKPLSFVYDIADIIKFNEVVPLAFTEAAKPSSNLERTVRLACRDLFRKDKTLDHLIPMIHDVLAAGEIEVPEAHPEAMPIAIPNEENIGDAGHRS